jgi:hypothetical protein
VAEGGLLPRDEALRGAIAWLAAHPEPSLALLEEASWRFDLTPLEAAILYRYFGPGARATGDTRP